MISRPRRGDWKARETRQAASQKLRIFAFDLGGENMKRELFRVSSVEARRGWWVVFRSKEGKEKEVSSLFFRSLLQPLPSPSLHFLCRTLNPFSRCKNLGHHQVRVASSISSLRPCVGRRTQTLPCLPPSFPPFTFPHPHRSPRPELFHEVHCESSSSMRSFLSL